MKPMSQKQINNWEKQRAKGKWHYILKTAVIWVVSVLSAIYLSAWFFGFQSTLSGWLSPFYILLGLFVGLVSWWTNEGKYQSDLLDKKIENGLKP